MKKTVKMTCIFKSGAKIEETIKIKKKDTETIRIINKMKEAVENSFIHSDPKMQTITFGYLIIRVSEIIALSIKEV